MFYMKNLKFSEDNLPTKWQNQVKESITIHVRMHDRHLGQGGDEGMVVTKRPVQGLLQVQ